MKPNTKWFRDRLADRQLSMRQLAKQLDLDPGAVSLMLRGLRKMTLEEANHIARLLEVPVTEVLRRAGVPVSEDVITVKLEGFIDGESKLQAMTGPKKAIVAPPDVPRGGFALQIRAPRHYQDGWIAMVGDTVPMPSKYAEGLCVITLRGGKAVVGTLRPGYDEDKYNVLLMLDSAGTGTLENVLVKSVAPVLWMRPQ